MAGQRLFGVDVDKLVDRSFSKGRTAESFSDQFLYLHDNVDPKVLDRLDPYERGIVCAVSQNDLMTEQGEIILPHAVGMRYYKEILWEMMKRDQKKLHQAQTIFRTAVDNFYGRLDAPEHHNQPREWAHKTPRITGLGVTTSGWQWNGINDLEYRAKGKPYIDNEIDKIEKVTDLNNAWVLDREFSKTKSIAPLRDFLKRSVHHTKIKLREKGMFEEARVLQQGQPYTVTHGDTIFIDDTNTHDETWQPAINRKYVLEKKLQIGSLNDLEFYVLLGIDSDIEDLKEAENTVRVRAGNTPVLNGEIPKLRNTLMRYFVLSHLERLTCQDYTERKRKFLDYVEFMYDEMCKEFNMNQGDRRDTIKRLKIAVDFAIKEVQPIDREMAERMNEKYKRIVGE